MWFVSFVNVSRRCWFAHSKQTDRAQCEHLMNDGVWWQLWHCPQASTWKLHDFSRSITVWFNGNSVSWPIVAQISLLHVFTGQTRRYLFVHSLSKHVEPERREKRNKFSSSNCGDTHRLCDHTWEERVVRCNVVNTMDNWSMFQGDDEESQRPWATLEQWREEKCNRFQCSCWNVH